MGMAASQARFLALTARKSNTEYHGQQINQQRTALSNQSANLYNQMMNLQVPTPPSPDSYYNISYVFQSGNSDDNANYAITSFSNLNKTVSVEYTTDANMMKQSNTYLSSEDGRTFMFGDQVAQLVAVSKSSKPEVYEAAGNIDNSDWNNADIFSIQVRDKDGRYVDSGYYVTGNYKDIVMSNKTSVAAWEIKEGRLSRNIEFKVNNFEFNESGRLASFTTTAEGCPSAKIPANQKFEVGFSKVKDDDAYEDAMNDYNYKKNQYDQKYNELNAETEKIQAKDKNLELKLKQLDTEQNAIQTEMEAVKNVIKKNVEDTFKTFNA